MADRIRILIADDHALVREGTRQILEREDDLEVVGEAADGEQTVALADSLRPNVAIVDIGMPKVNGVEATRRIKAEHPEIGVLVLTVHDDDAYVHTILEAGAAGYLLKDVHGPQLVEAVRSIGSGEAVLHPSIARKVLGRFRGEAVGAGAAPALTEREAQVLGLAARGMSNKRIGTELGLSGRTVQVHLARVFRKLGVASRTEAVIKGVRLGLISLEELD